MIQSLLNPELMQRFAGSLIHFVWQGALIAMIAAIVLRLLANRSAESRYTVSVAAMLLMLVAPVITFMFYAQTGHATLKLLRIISNSVKASAHSGVQSATLAAATTSWTQWIVLAWIFGVLICSIRLIAGWTMSRSLTKAGTSAVPSEIQQSFNEVMERLAMTTPVRLLASLRIDTPVAIGWLRPVVLLPLTAITGLDEAQLRAVLAHELAHIRRHDFLVNLLQRGVESILFYHPAVWWLSARIRSEREHCCDDLAVQISGNRLVYAEALIELERVRTAAPELAVAATGGNLTQRIRRVLGYRMMNDDWRSAIAALLFIVVWIAAGTWQSGNTLHAKAMSPLPVPSAILTKTAVAIPSVTGAVNAIAAIVTAASVQPIEPAQSTAVGNGAIEGVLRDESGKPAAGFRVTAIVPSALGGSLSNPDKIFVASTDNDGHYRVTGIPPGQYSIAAGRVGFPTFYPGTLDVDGSRVVTVVPGATVANINFAMEPISNGLLPPIVSKPPSTSVAGGNLVGTLGPGGTLRLFVTIQIEGGGKIPVFANGHFPRLRLTKVDTKTPYGMWFRDTVIGVPRNYTTVPDEYNVAVEDLPEGYTVKSITYRADEPGLRFEDVLHGTMKLSARASDSAGGGNPDAGGAPDLPIAITLTHTPSRAPGIRVSGVAEGIAPNRRLPNFGASAASALSLSDVGVYLSGKPGVLYSDGTFEFAGVSPGLHSVVLYSTTSGSSKFDVAEVAIRDRDVEGVTLQTVQILPKNFFSPKQLPAGGTNTAMTALSSITGRVLDEATQQPVTSATVTLTGTSGAARGYASTRLDTFRILNLLPGQYSMTVEANGYNSMTQQITVGTTNAPLDIRMTH